MSLQVSLTSGGTRPFRVWVALYILSAGSLSLTVVVGFLNFDRFCMLQLFSDSSGVFTITSCC